MQLVPVRTLKQLEDEARRAADAQRTPVIQGLAAHVRKRWEAAKSGKRDLEERMLQCLRQRRGEYDPEKLQEIRQIGGSEIYVMLTSVKCRAATSWLRDSLLGIGADKPWRLEPTPIPDLPPDVTANMQAVMAQQLFTMAMAGQETPPPQQLKQLASSMRDELLRQLHDEAEKRVARMEEKIEDQLIEGGFLEALSALTDDLATFPFAVLKGPVVRRRMALRWEDGALVPKEILRPEWERVDPFMLYWAPWARGIDSAPLIERHKLTREDLEALIGVEGYSEGAIREILADFGGGGLTHGDTYVDSTKADAEGKQLGQDDGNDDLVDALQLWDNIQGKLLLEWGLDKDEIADPLRSYPCEVWLVKDKVIKAVLNYDPLGRKPYYVTSYEKVPGSVSGNGVSDLVRDSQAMCNAAARSISNNMGISSGPQVGIDISRLPQGEDITQMYPWKIWQFQRSDYSDGSNPITFFQPNSNAQELMAVFERFSSRADEDSGIPRYMTGEHVAGAGRTSSGLSMLISNAGKGIKQVISNLDTDVLTPALERQYQYNLRYDPDPDFIGDVNIVARGAMSLVVKEAEAVRRNEFLQIVLNSPVAQQIVGQEGVAELLRDVARTLSDRVDGVVPSREQVAQAAQAMAMQQAAQAAPMPAVGANLQADGSQQGGRASNFISARPNNQ